MRVALGLKAHSGWAALVIVGVERREIQVVDRRRIELVDKDASWAKAPYHAAEEMDAAKARRLVERATEMACRVAARELKLALDRARESGHDVAACAVLVPNAMPDWSVEQILA